MKEKSTLLTVGGYRIAWKRKPIKRLHLRIKPPDGEIILSSPMRLSREDAERFVSENLAWIAEHLPSCLVERKEPPLSDGESVPLFGSLYRIRTQYARSTSATVSGEEILLSLPKDDRAHRASALASLYRRELAEQAERMLAHFTALTALKPGRISYRRMKSKWGSCRPSDGAITLNLYLALYDLSCLAYVILHELVHLRHADHGKGFYALLESYMPDWRDRKRRLTDSALLMRGRLPI